MKILIENLGKMENFLFQKKWKNPLFLNGNEK